MPVGGSRVYSIRRHPITACIAVSDSWSPGIQRARQWIPRVLYPDAQASTGDLVRDLASSTAQHC